MLGGSSASEFFDQVMGKTLGLLIVSLSTISCMFYQLWKNYFNKHVLLNTYVSFLQKNLDSYVQDCYDTIALFLSVHIILRYQLLCHKRAVPALDHYFDTLQGIIWPR